MLAGIIEVTCASFFKKYNKEKRTLTMKVASCIALLLFANLCHAFVIDFEDLPRTGSIDPIVSGDLNTKTFTFTGIGGNPFNLAIDSTGLVPGNSTNFLTWCPFCTMTMENTAGDLFTLFSLELFGAPGSSGDVSVTGYLANGNTLTTSLDVVALSPTTFNFGAEWTTLEKVEFGSLAPFGAGIDNMVVAPLPAAFWLFGSALAGLGWARRKQLNKLAKQ